MSSETALARLAAEGERRSAARREAANAMAEIERLARSAYKGGARKSDIARAAQISRPALDAILKD